MTLASPSIRNILSFFTLSAGVALLATAWRVGNAFPKSYGLLLYSYDFIAWIYIAFCLVALGVRSGFSYKSLNRCLLVLGIFGLTVFPHKINDYELLTTRTLSLAGGLLLFLGLTAWTPVHRWCVALLAPLRWIASCPPRLFGVLVFLIFLTQATWLAWHCFSFIPGFGDSLSQYIQAKFMARGMLYGPTHPLQPFFDSPMTVFDHGKWYAQYSPGHVIMLALGHFFQVAWLVNPLQGALTAWALYALARCVCDEVTAKLAAVLMLLSQFTLFMSSEFMNHPTALLATTLFLLCYVKTLQTRVELWAIGAGLALGALFLTRPLSAIGAGLPFAMYGVILMWRNPRAWLPPFLLMGMAAALCLVFELWYDLQLTGSMWILPSGQFHRVSNWEAMGYGENSSPIKSFWKIQDEWEYLNLCLFEWFIPSTLFVWVACLRPLENRFQRLLLAMLFTYTAADMINQFHSHIFGPRYLYEISTALFILSAIGMRRVPALMARWPSFTPGREVMGGITAVLVFACFVPAAVHGLPGNLRLYSWHYFNNHPDFYYGIVAQAETPALVFIESPAPNDLASDPEKKSGWVAFTMPPFDDNPIIFARDLGKEKDQLLIQYYPQRKAYMERKGKLYEFGKEPAP